MGESSCKASKSSVTSCNSLTNTAKNEALQVYINWLATKKLKSTKRKTD